MEILSWLCLFLPLAGVTLLALLHTRVTREVAAWLPKNELELAVLTRPAR